MATAIRIARFSGRSSNREEERCARCHAGIPTCENRQIACRAANQQLISPNETPVATYTRVRATEEPWQMAVNRINDRLRVPVTDKRAIPLVFHSFRAFG